MGKGSLDGYTLLSRSRAGMASLWKGEDHLLYIRGSGFLLPFTEEYKRYRFEDIQSLALSKRSRWGKGLLYGSALGVILLVLALILALTDRESFGTGTAVMVSIFSIGALISLGLLVRHLVLGPPCFCDIQTNLSRDRLRPLDRFHLARETLEKLDGAIRRRQAGMFSDVMTEAVSAGEMSSRARGGRWHLPWPVLPTFILSALFGLSCLAGIHLESLSLAAACLVGFLALCLLLLLSLVFSVRQATPHDVRSWLWALLGLVFVFSAVSVVFLFLAAAGDPVYTLDFFGPLEAFLSISSGDGWVFYTVFVSLFLLVTLCGVVGSVFSLKWRRKIASARMREEEMLDGGNPTGEGDTDG